jgi:hypothetical protein
MPFFFINYPLLTLNSFSDVSDRNSSTVFHSCLIIFNNFKIFNNCQHSARDFKVNFPACLLLHQTLDTRERVNIGMGDKEP